MSPEELYESLLPHATERLNGPPPLPGDAQKRIELWRRDEWHNWFRWRLCRQGRIDWSKPAAILILTAGFAGLIAYGCFTGRWYVTAGGVVLWFTAVNLSFFAYFGLTLPGPPPPVPGPFQAGQKVRAIIGVYPPGYERRKLARVRVRLTGSDGEAIALELALKSLTPELTSLIARQQMTRMQRADAPATEAIVETLDISREQIDAGEHSLQVIAWKWDENSFTPWSGKSEGNG